MLVHQSVFRTFNRRQFLELSGTGYGDPWGPWGLRLARLGNAIDLSLHVSLVVARLGGAVSKMIFPLVMTNIAMENHHFSWENPLFLWPFSIAM